MQTTPDQHWHRSERLSDSGIAVVSAAGLGLLLIELWSRPQDIYSVPPAGYLLAALAVLTLFGRRLPWLLWAYWLAAALTLIWSLAPGHTLLALQWELVFLASVVAGMWSPGYWLLMVPLLLFGLDRTILFSVFGFLEGGESLLLYQAGAQALLLVAPAMVMLLGHKKPWWLRGIGGILSVAALYVALASGARSVYVPLLAIVLLVVVRLVRVGASKWRLAANAFVLVMALLATDALISGHPMVTAMQRNVPGLARDTAEASAGSQVSGVVWRLRMAEQALAMSAAHPSGTGVGSFPAVVHRYQRYPMLWSNSAHNFYLETLATGGPLRLLLLAAILALAVVTGCRGNDWPVAVGVAGYWATLAFDVGNLSPGVMAVGWWGVGYCLAKSRRLPSRVRPQQLLVWFGVLGAAVAVAWWHLPCQNPDCALMRHLAFPRTVAVALEDAPDAERVALLAGAARRYPESAWVDALYVRFAENEELRLEATRLLAERYPYQHPDRYLDWARAAQVLGDRGEERHALEAGLAVFNEEAWVPTGRRLTSAQLLERVAAMRNRLAELNGGN